MPYSPMWKKHQNLLSNNNDAPSITKNGSLVRPHAQIVALRLHCTRTALSAPPKERYETQTGSTSSVTLTLTQPLCRHNGRSSRAALNKQERKKVSLMTALLVGTLHPCALFCIPCHAQKLHDQPDCTSNEKRQKIFYVCGNNRLSEIPHLPQHFFQPLGLPVTFCIICCWSDCLFGTPLFLGWSRVWMS